MNLLLDTHSFIWWDDEPARLSSTARAACEDRRNLLHLSLASVWELQIKAQLGKVRLPRPLAELVRAQVRRNRLVLLPITFGDILALQELPPLHRDPFDRLLIAQTRRHSFRLVGCDPAIAAYNVEVLW